MLQRWDSEWKVRWKMVAGLAMFALAINVEIGSPHIRIGGPRDIDWL